MSVFLRGIVMGVAIAAPIGPLGLLCIRRTMERGLHVGIATGVGGSVGDTFLAALAAVGVNAILETVMGHTAQLQVVGGIFLLAVALHSFLRVPRAPNRTGAGRSLVAAAGSGLALTVTNPLTILGTITLVVSFAGNLTDRESLFLVMGVLSGSLGWATLLCGGVWLMRHHVTLRTVRLMNIGTGVFLAALGLWVLGTAAASAVAALR